MDNISYVNLTRQMALRSELQIIANNIANMGTTGFRAEGIVFSENLKAVPTDGGSISMTGLDARYVNNLPGAQQKTGGTFDLAIGGAGFFMVETPNGVRLTRNGAFGLNENSEMVTFDGHRVLDAGGAPIFVPPDAAKVSISRDGTMSTDGQLQAQVGLVNVDSVAALTREGSNLFSTDQPLLPVDDPVISQGFLEASNVNPVLEITRMIEVQRAYEMAARLAEKEDQRVKNVITTLGQST